MSDWCCEKPAPLPGIPHTGVIISARIQDQLKITPQDPNDAHEIIDMWRRKHKLPLHYRCGLCKRRLKIQYRFCQDWGCIHAALPPHKVKRSERS